MTKKAFFTLVLSILLIPVVFSAGTSSFFLQGIPYTSRLSDGRRSSYGFGAEAGYRYNIWRGVKVGADISFRTYSFDSSPRQYVFSFLAKAGWKQTFGPDKKLAAALYLGLGADVVSSSSVTDVFLAVTAGTAFACKVSNHLSVVAGVDYGLTDRSVTAKVGMIFTLTRFPYRGAGVGLVMDGRILMGKRMNTPMFADTWAVPGGTYEKTDADDLETALRETWEETAIDITKLDAVSLGEWHLSIPFAFSWKTYFYSIESLDQEIILREFSEYRWLEIDKILSGEYKDLDFRPFTGSEIRRLKNLLEAQK